MKQIFNQQGFLTQEGAVFVKDNFVAGVDKVLNTASNEDELKVIGSILSNIIGAKISEKLANKNI
jgi:virulence-associated protein VapD